MSVSSVISHNQLNQISCKIEAIEKQNNKLLKTIDEANEDLKKTECMVSIAQAISKIVANLLLQPAAKRNLEEALAQFETVIAEELEISCSTYQSLLHNRHHYIQDKKSLNLTKEKRSEFLQLFLSSVTQEIEKFRDEFFTRTDLNLKVLSKNLVKKDTSLTGYYQQLLFNKTALTMRHIALIDQKEELKAEKTKILSPTVPVNKWHACEMNDLVYIQNKIAELGFFQRRSTFVNELHEHEEGIAPLHIASANGNLPLATLLLMNKADPSLRSRLSYEPLHFAAEAGSLDVALKLIQAQANVNALGWYQRTPLHMAARNRQPAMIELLGSNHAKTNLRTNAYDGNKTALHEAVLTKDLKTVNALLKYSDFKVIIKDARIQSALYPAVELGYVEIVRAFVTLPAYQCSAEVKDPKFFEALLQLRPRENEGEIKELLTALQLKKKIYCSDVWMACREGSTTYLEDQIKLYYFKKAFVNQINARGFSLLGVAVLHEQYEAVLFLLENGANLTLGKSLQPLHFAAKIGNLVIAELLLKYGAPVDGKKKLSVNSKQTRARLFRSVEMQRLEKSEPRLVRDLLQQYENLPGIDETTPLHLATSPAMIKLLISKGADVNAQMSDEAEGITSFHKTVRRGDLDAVGAFTETAADNLNVNIRDVHNITPLRDAVALGDVEIARLIITHTNWQSSSKINDPNHIDNLLLIKPKKNAEGIRTLLTPHSSNPVQFTTSAAASSAKMPNPPSSSSRSFSSQNEKMFSIQPTEADGACALHALLGSETEGRYVYPDDVRAYFISALKSGNDEVKKVVKSVLADMLRDSISPRANQFVKMLFNNEKLKYLREGITEYLNANILEQKDHQQKQNDLFVDIWNSYEQNKNLLSLFKILNLTEAEKQEINQSPEKRGNFFRRNLDAFINTLIDSKVGKDLSTYNTRIKELINQRDAQFLKAIEVNFNEVMVAYYNTCKNPSYYFSDPEIGIAALLFDKKVHIYAKIPTGYEGPQPYGSGEDLINIYHEGMHYARCIPL